MSIEVLNDALREATPGKDVRIEKSAGEEPLDQVLLNDLHVEAGKRITTTHGFITIVGGEGTLDCTQWQSCNCASLEDEGDRPVNLEL